MTIIPRLNSWVIFKLNGLNQNILLKFPHIQSSVFAPVKHLISFRDFLWTKGIDGGAKLTRNVSFISRLLFKLNLLIENYFLSDRIFTWEE